MRLEFGPAGIGGVKEAIMNLESFSRAGLKCAEIAFTYSIYIKKEEAVIIGKRAKELGISLSIHSPYYVNLNSKEREKREASKKRILNCCEIGYYLGARKIVFHCGYYTKSDESSKEETFQNIKKAVLEMQKIIKEKKWNSILCPEIMGKKNVFGSIEEVSRLVNETGCGFCIDFAHVLARYGKIEMKSIEENFPQKEWHCHFSGIIYGDKGEKRHRDTKKEEWKSLLKQLPKNKEISIICEAPNPFKDVVEGLDISKEF